MIPTGLPDLSKPSRVQNSIRKPEFLNPKFLYKTAKSCTTIKFSAYIEPEVIQVLRALGLNLGQKTAHFTTETPSSADDLGSG